jgi:hypothetical protein
LIDCYDADGAAGQIVQVLLGEAALSGQAVNPKPRRSVKCRFV